MSRTPRQPPDPPWSAPFLSPTQPAKVTAPEAIEWTCEAIPVAAITRVPGSSYGPAAGRARFRQRAEAGLVVEHSRAREHPPAT